MAETYECVACRTTEVNIENLIRCTKCKQLIHSEFPCLADEELQWCTVCAKKWQKPKDVPVGPVVRKAQWPERKARV